MVALLVDTHETTMQLWAGAISACAPLKICASDDECHALGTTCDVIFVHDRDGAPAGLIGPKGCSAFPIPIVAYREAPSPQRVVTAIEGGVADYFACPPDRASFRHWFEDRLPQLQARARERHDRAEMSRRLGELSLRQQQSLERLAQGCTAKQIARDLNISPRTVEIHIATMRERLAVDSSRAAAALWFKARSPV